jgi:hypothetical protein
MGCKMVLAEQRLDSLEATCVTLSRRRSAKNAQLRSVGPLSFAQGEVEVYQSLLDDQLQQEGRVHTTMEGGEVERVSSMPASRRAYRCKTCNQLGHSARSCRLVIEDVD